MARDKALQTLRHGVVVPTIAAGLALAVLVSLGLWQLDRKAWKEGLIATLEQRFGVAAVALPPPAEWSKLTPTEDEFLRVTATVEFLNDLETLVYTGGSTLRDATGQGYWVFTPARISDSGRLVMINRGFVPEGNKDPASGRADQRPNEPHRRPALA
jgi:surfeit locus 1 family protein